MMTLPKQMIALLSGAALLSAGSLFGGTAAPSVSTDPVGYITSTVYGNGGTGERLTLISPSFHSESAVAGTITTEGASSLVVSAPMTAGAYDGGLYYVEVIDSNGVGYWTDVISNTADTLTVNDDLTGFIANGNSFVVRQHLTIGGLFGEGNEAGLNAGSSLNAADNIQVIRFSDGVSSNSTYWYSSIVGFEGWRDASFVLSDDVVVAPHEGLIVIRKVSGDLPVVFTGKVRTNDVNFPVEEGLNVCSVPSAAAKTLDNSGLANYLTAGSSLNAADNIQVLEGDGSNSTYWYSNIVGFEGWRDASFAASGAVVLEPGTSFIVYRRSGAVNVAMSSTLPVSE